MVKDLTGMRFDSLVVIEYSGTDKHRKALWKCKCDCGNETIVVGSSLVSKRSGSCGCLKKKKISEKNYKDITGMRFGKLIVIEKVENKGKKIAWKCKCDCGNETIVVGSHLKSGNTVSCGCVCREKSSERLKKLSEQQIGDKSPSWQGGITTIENFLRSRTRQWDNNVRTFYHKECALTGRKCTARNSAVHHLYGFNMIVKEAHKNNNIKIKPQVKDYTHKELELLDNYILSWHNDVTNGILLHNDVHRIFHKLYGKGNNTPEQFEEFKQRYLAGEFKEILK